MQHGAGHSRRGAKAHMLNKLPTGMPPSPELPQESSLIRRNAQGHQGQPNHKQIILAGEVDALLIGSKLSDVRMPHNN
jgi:hypothetical protein